MFKDIKFEHYADAKTNNGLCEFITVERNKKYWGINSYLNKEKLIELEKRNPTWKYELCKLILEEYKDGQET